VRRHLGPSRDNLVSRGLITHAYFVCHITKGQVAKLRYKIKKGVEGSKGFITQIEGQVEDAAKARRKGN